MEATTPILKKTYKLQEPEEGHFLVSLPSFWANALNLKKGDKIELQVLGNGTIVIKPALPTQQSKKEFLYYGQK